jgi:hypothetical protein
MDLYASSFLGFGNRSSLHGSRHRSLPHRGTHEQHYWYEKQYKQQIKQPGQLQHLHDLATAYCQLPVLVAGWDQKSRSAPE